MNNLNERYHFKSIERYKLKLEHKPDGYCVKVYFVDKPAAQILINSAPDPIKESYSFSGYETPSYDSEEEAYIHACGFLDGFGNQTDINKEKNFWKETYNNFREIYQERHKVKLSFDKKLEEAYKTGWQTKFVNEEIDN
jgi:hypothetical protein